MGLAWKNRRHRRAASRPEARVPANSREARVPWDRHDTLWITDAIGSPDAANQLIDLQAQVGLFLLQTKVVRRHGEVRDHLVEYLRGTLRWQGVEEPDADVYQVYEHLLTHKWWLDGLASVAQARSRLH
jgi:hypothetical protein